MLLQLSTIMSELLQGCCSCLQSLCLLQARDLLCDGAFDEGRMRCVDPGGCEADGKCCKDSCGFKGLWSKGLREKLVGPDGELKPGVNPVWLQHIEWERYKTEKKEGEKQRLRNNRSG